MNAEHRPSPCSQATPPIFDVCERPCVVCQTRFSERSGPAFRRCTTYFPFDCPLAMHRVSNILEYDICSVPKSESLGRTRHCHDGCIECTAGVISPRMLEEWRENWISAAQYEIGSDTRWGCDLRIVRYRSRSGKGPIKASCPSSALARGKIWYPMAAWTFGTILELHICAWIRELREVVTWYVRCGQDCFKDSNFELPI